jgi:integrase
LNPRRPMPTGPKPVSFDQTRTPPLTTRTVPLMAKGKILSVLVKLKSLGSSESTLRSYGYRLSTIAKHVNLDNPDEVARFISNINGSNAYKESFVKAYNHYVKFNGLKWNKPKYKYERRIPRIPTREAIEKIIARSSRKYATIFRLLTETGAMPHELHNVTIRDIDLDRATIAIQGFKGHSSRIFKLKPETLAMFKTYLKEHGNTKPLFPNSRCMLKAWMRARNLLAEKLKEPQLRTIRLYDLRHYFATMTYYKTKDILYVKQQMGHKKLETTLICTQLVNFGEDEYICRVAKTIDQARQLIEQCFEYVTGMDGVKIFRKRK